MRARAAAIGLVLLGVACRRHAPAPPVRTSAADAGAEPVHDAGAVDAVVAPPVLEGHPALVELRDGQEKLGVVAVPLGAHEPRPILVALHGGSERPDAACPRWKMASDGYPFVVCPHGWGGDERRLGWRSAADTSARIARAVAATKARFGDWVAPARTTVLAGFSMGGSQVARLARREPETYRRIVVGDSAHEPRPALTFAAEWTKGGGERAMFLCTTSGCEPSMRAAAKNVAAAKAPARLVIAPTQVHGLSEAAAQSMRRDWAWLVEGVEGWSGYAPASAPGTGRTESFDP